MSKAKTAFNHYYQLSKPGIIRGNLLTAAAGYIFGSAFDLDWLVLAGLLLGLTSTIAGACATNNYLDRGIDAKMKRTQKRALVSGQLSSRQALTYAGLTTVIGIGILYATQNVLTASLAAFAWFAYVVLYGYAKRVTVHGTLVGCISGSIPLVAGYTATSGKFDLIAIQLAVLMTAWQMAHFYGIALYRLKDYKAASIPVMPAVYGVRTTKWQIMGYIVLLMAGVIWMQRTDSLTVPVAILLLGLAIIWLSRGQKTWRSADADKWGKSMFLFSLIVIMGISIGLVANPLIST